MLQRTPYITHGVADAAVPFFTEEPQVSDLNRRASSAGADTLTDAEVLQLLIARGSRDASAMSATSLIARFGDLRRTLAATPSQLRQFVDRDTALLLQVVQDATRRICAAELPQRDLLTSTSAVVKYLKAATSHLTHEEFRVLLLDKKNQLIADEVLGVGTVDHCPAYPREIVRRCLDAGASAALLSHNHPSGVPTPSTQDIKLTNEIRAAAKLFGIAIHDHFIVGRDSVFSITCNAVVS